MEACKTLFPVREYSVDDFRGRIDSFNWAGNVAWGIGLFLMIYSFVASMVWFFLGLFFILLKIRFQSVSRKIQGYQALYIRGQSIPDLSGFTLGRNLFMPTTISFFMLFGFIAMLICIESYVI